MTTTQVEIGFDSPDPVMKVILREINALPDDSPERADAEWMLYNVLARAAARRAEQLRRPQP